MAYVTERKRTSSMSEEASRIGSWWRNHDTEEGPSRYLIVGNEVGDRDSVAVRGKAPRAEEAIAFHEAVGESVLAALE